MLRRVIVRRFTYGTSTRLKFATAAEDQASKPFSEIPQVPTVPILGAGWNYLPFIGKYKLTAMHHASELKYKEHGPIVREAFNKDHSVVHLFEPQDFEALFRKEGRYPNRRPFFCFKQYRDQRKDLFPNAGISFSEGEEWYNARSKVQPHMMKPKAIHSYLRVMDEVARQLVDNTAALRKGNGGEVQDYLKHLYNWALESVGAVALDARLGCLDAKPNEEASKMIVIVRDVLVQILKLEFGPLPLWKHFNTPMKRKFTRNLDDFNAIVLKHLTMAHMRLKSLPEDHEKTFLQSILSPDEDPRNATTTIATMFLAGIDSSSTAAGLTLYHLARNREAQDKAYQEVKAVLQDQGMTVESLNSIRYLKACVKEALRLTPVNLGTGRIVPEDVVIRGYRVKAGTFVMVNSFTAGRSEKNFKDPLVYRPERFLREESSHHPFSFLPFGFGPRSCIGKRIAEQEIWIVLMRVLERFRVEYHKGEIDLVTRLINTPDRPLDFQFFDR